MIRNNADIIRNAWGDIMLQSNIENDNLEQDLRRKWSQLGNKISFAGASKIYKFYKGKISKGRIEEILSTIPTYSRYKEKRRPNTYNPIFVYYKHQIWSIDLMYVRKWKGYNDGIQYFFTLIESYSRKLFLVPMHNKTTDTTLSSFQALHQHIGRSPKMLYLDKGGEFMSERFRQYCDFFRIKLVFSESPYKSSLVERAQRTLQNIMFRYMNHRNTKRYIDALPDIIHTFNSRVNRTIGLSPNAAFQPRNKHVALYNLEQHYQKSLRKRSKARFKVNTRVRILRLSQNKHFSRKAFVQNFTEEIFTIYKVCNRLPFTRYFIKDEENEQIRGSFQAYELTPVR